MFKKKFSITAILFISWQLNAQIALPTLQAVQYAGESALYSFSSHTFTNCGKTGYSGPTLAECKSSYDVSWEDDTDFFDVPSNAGIQLWTVPETATYRIEVWGAQGAFINSGHSYSQVVQGGGGKGSRMRGDFNLTMGDKIKILVGQMGRGGYAASGGGGGTFVATANNTALIVAGGCALQGQKSWPKCAFYNCLCKNMTNSVKYYRKTLFSPVGVPCRGKNPGQNVYFIDFSVK